MNKYKNPRFMYKTKSVSGFVDNDSESYKTNIFYYVRVKLDAPIFI